MPWELAGLYGVVPLLVCMCVLEIVAEWERAPLPAKAVAYVIMGGAMFLSASATGAVVLSAAPPHFSLLFGALLDAAELLAAYFIMNGPRAADEAAEAAAEAEREAARIAQQAAHEAAARAAQASLRAELDSLRADLGTAQAGREEAERIAGEAEEKSETLARKIAAASARKKGARAPASKGANARTARVPDDIDARAAALEILGTEPDISGAELGPRVGMSKRWGQLRKNEYAGVSPEGGEAGEAS
jgi:hypothetical protein